MAYRANPHAAHERYVVRRADLQQLHQALTARGYQVVGPTVSGDTIIYDELESVDELPAGLRDEQEGGIYRLRRRNDGALFGFTPGPHSWKRFLHPPELVLWQARRTQEGMRIDEPARAAPRLAFFGVRACELHAIQIQDTIFLQGPYVDPDYKARREAAFIVAVNCTRAGGTCFCVSTETGPEVPPGFDLALTEVVDESTHYFVVEVGSEEGAAVLDDVAHRIANEDEMERADCLVAAITSHMGRTLETEDLGALLNRNLEHPFWDDVAERCLACGNCTLVCPTCFCCTVEDTTSLDGDMAERRRRDDSCFNTAFSYVYGGSVRASTRARYRQWLVHKLGTWQEQFGSLGCVGCGRCITWCPVGIDLTKEVARLRALDKEE